MLRWIDKASVVGGRALLGIIVLALDAPGLELGEEIGEAVILHHVHFVLVILVVSKEPSVLSVLFSAAATTTGSGRPSSHSVSIAA